jgi:hypothetical protein
MSAAIVPLNPDQSLPIHFDLSPEKAMAARADCEMAKIMKLWAQESIMIATRGEMTPARRLKLLEAYSVILDHPRIM